MKVSRNSEEISHYIQTYNFHTLFLLISYRMLNYIPFRREKRYVMKGRCSLSLLLNFWESKIYMSHKNGKVSLINFIQAPSVHWGIRINWRRICYENGGSNGRLYMLSASS